MRLLGRRCFFTTSLHFSKSMSTLLIYLEETPLLLHDGKECLALSMGDIIYERKEALWIQSKLLACFCTQLKHVTKWKLHTASLACSVLVHIQIGLFIMLQGVIRRIPGPRRPKH